MLSLPFSLVGGLWLLWALGFNLSVAVAVGFIALAGVAPQTGVVMLIYLDHALTEGRAECAAAHRPFARADLNAAIMRGAVERVRPKMMTVVAIMAGLLPIMRSTGAGSEVMQRIAVPMIGRMVSSTLLTLIAFRRSTRWSKGLRFGGIPLRLFNQARCQRSSDDARHDCFGRAARQLARRAISFPLSRLRQMPPPVKTGRGAVSLGREVAPGQNGPDVPQVDVRGFAFGGAFGEVRQHVGDLRSRPQSSILDRRISSNIVSTLIISSIVFRPRQSRPSDGGQGDEEAGASPATGTKRRSASALAAKQQTCLREAEASLRRRQANGAIKPEEGRSWCGVDGGARC
jgi:AcrB/AcrD/AcrF family